MADKAQDFGKGGAVVGPPQEAPMTTAQILGHTLKDIGEALGPAELELLYGVTRNTLAQGGASAGTLAGQLHDLASGLSPTSDLSAQNTSEAAAPVEYKPQLEVSQFLTSKVGTPVLNKLSQWSKQLGEFTRGKVMQGDKGRLTGSGQVLTRQRPDRATESALLATGAEMATDLAPVLLMRETPLSRAIKARVTEPVKAKLAAGYEAAQEVIHKGAYKAARETQKTLTEQAGKENALQINVAQVYSGWKKQKVTEQENANILAYMEDPTGKAPLTDRERILYTTYIKPYADALGWTPGYVHRIALEKPNAIAALMGGFKSPSITPRLSTQESAVESREMFKATPIISKKVIKPKGTVIKQYHGTDRAEATFGENRAVWMASSPKGARAWGKNVHEIEFEPGHELTLEKAKKSADEIDAAFKKAGVSDSDRLYIMKYLRRGDPDAFFYSTPEIERAYRSLGYDSLHLEKGYLVNDEEWRVSLNPSEQINSKYKATEDAAEDRDHPPLIVSIKPTPFKDTYTATFFHEGEKVGMQEEVPKPEGKSFKGTTLTDAQGNKYKIGDASIKDIERHTSVRYVRNPMVMVGEAFRERSLKEYSQATLDKLKVTLGTNGLMTAADDPRRPTNFVPLDNYHFHGFVAHPAIARVVNAMVGQSGIPRVLDSFNKAMLNASFIVPIWHQLNLAAFAMSDAISRAAHTGVWRDVAKNTARAYKEVSTYGKDYTTLLNKGYPMLKARTMAAHDLKELTRQLLQETDSDRFKGMAGKAGVPVELMRRGLDWFLNNWEHGPVWTFNDTVTMRAIYDRMSANPKLTLEQAADDTFKAFPRYEIPYHSSVLTGIQRSGLFWFLPYHLDRIRILWNRAGGAALGDTQAAGQLMGTIIMQSVMFPELDNILQEKSKNKKASVERFGEAKIPDVVEKIASRDKSMWSVVSLLLTPTPPAQVLVSGTEYQATRKKHGKQPPLSQQAEAIGSDVAQRSIYPLYDAAQAGWDPAAALLAQMGVKLPAKKKGKGGIPSGEPPMPKEP